MKDYIDDGTSWRDILAALAVCTAVCGVVILMGYAVAKWVMVCP